jgi:histidinol-phosphatase (PHP family)
LLTSYHNHTTWSDGASSFGEMIAGARSAGLDEFGVSDHFALFPDGSQRGWSLNHHLLGEYVSQITRAAENPGQPVVRLGLEVDYFPETIDSVRQLLSPYAFDFLICSVHFANGFAVDLNPQSWSQLQEEDRNAVWRSYWRNLRAAVQTNLFDFVGHFDLPKKFGSYPTIDLTGEALAVLDAMAEADMALELNTAGWDKPVREAYPSMFYLKEANHRKIPLIINADAHRVEDLVNHFDQARALAAEAGYTELVSFRGRRRSSHPLQMTGL